MELNGKVPSGPIEQQWDQHKFDMKLVAPHNRRRFKVIVIGTGLAGGAAAATLGELGYDVHCFTFHDSPRRAHSIAAQCGIIARHLHTGEVKSYSAHAVVLATGGYGNVFYLSTNAKASNATAIWRAHRKGALFANPCFTQIHPTCIPASDDFQSKLTLMSESLRNDGRVWVPSNPDDTRSPDQIPETDRDYFLERRYPAFGNLVPRDVASRAIKVEVDKGNGVGPLKNGAYLDFSATIARLGRDTIEEGYGN